MELFISWSGNASRRVAEALASFLEHIVPDVNPFISNQNIEAGEHWEARLNEELNRAHHGVLCLTRDNQAAPWLNYEAGRLSQVLGRTRIIPYTIGFPPNEIAVTTLSRFQGVRNDEAGTWILVETLNGLTLKPRREKFLREGFELFWPRFNADMEAAIRSALPAAPPTQDATDLLIELRSHVLQIRDALAAGSDAHIDPGAQDLANVTLDRLTNLPNRRAFASRGQAIAAAGTPVVVAMIDIDKFGQINNLMGHLEGDRIITAVGKVLTQELSSAGIVFRYGGDVFGVLFTGISSRASADLIDHAGGSVTAALKQESGISVTVSAGISSDSIAGFDEKIEEAQAALYDAKRAGGDRTTTAVGSRQSG